MDGWRQGSEIWMGEQVKSLVVRESKGEMILTSEIPDHLSIHG